MTEEQVVAPVEAEAPAPEVQAEAPAEAASPDRETLEAEARRFGWKPKEEWKGDTSNWTDADKFLEYARNAPASIKRLETRLEAKEREFNERLERMQKFQERAIEAARKKAEDDARAQMRAAVESADVEAFDRAQKRLEAVKAEPAMPEPAGPPPEVAQFLDAHPVLKDPAAHALLNAIGDEAFREGHRTAAAQVAYAEKRLKAMGILREPEPPKPQPRVTAVDGGGLASAAPRSKGWADIPGEERGLIRRQIADGIFKDEAAAAKAYWAEYGA